MKSRRTGSESSQRRRRLFRIFFTFSNPWKIRAQNLQDLEKVPLSGFGFCRSCSAAQRAAATQPGATHREQGSPPSSTLKGLRNALAGPFQGPSQPVDPEQRVSPLAELPDPFRVERQREEGHQIKETGRFQTLDAFSEGGKSGCGLVGFSSVHAFIRLAERAQAAFDVLHQPETEPALGFPRAPANRAVNADFGHLSVHVCNFSHVSSLRFFGCESTRILP